VIRDKEFAGTLMVLGAAILWGSSATGAQFLQHRGVNTLLISQTRVSLFCVVLFLFLAAQRARLLRVSPKDLWRLLLLCIIGVAGANFTYYFAMKLSNVAMGILLQYLAPLAVLGYTVLSGEETLSARKAFAAVASLVGCVLAVGGAGPFALRVSPYALGMGLLSMGCFAFLTFFSRDLLRQNSSWTVIAYSLLAASLFWSFVNPPEAVLREDHPASTWVSLATLSVSSILFPYLLCFSGLRRISPSRVIVTSTLEPVVAIGSAALALGELLDGSKALGAVLVLAAILVLQGESQMKTSHAHQISRENDGT
jgi:drug/metabolite transporter (DMT)-like permease